MTQDEANKIAAIIATADGGCSVCVENLIRRMNSADLGFTFKQTGADIEEQADWSDDPEDTVTYPGVVAIKVEA